MDTLFASPSNMPVPNKDDSFLNGFRKFVKGIKEEDPSNLVTKIKANLSEEAKQSIDEQLKTIDKDLDALQAGKMSYAEMRALYG